MQFHAFQQSSEAELRGTILGRFPTASYCGQWAGMRGIKVVRSRDVTFWIGKTANDDLAICSLYIKPPLGPDRSGGGGNGGINIDTRIPKTTHRGAS